MIIWLLLLGEFIAYGIPTAFLLFGAFCWVVWAVRLLQSRPYEPFTGDAPDLGVSVLVPTFNEAPQELKKNVETILKNISRGDEVLVIFDRRDNGRDQFQLDDPRVRVLSASNGKREAIRVGVEKAQNPIFLLTASDTRFTSTTIREILIPFNDDSVGGVTGRVTVAHRFGLGAWCYRWALTLRNLIIYPAMSRRGVVHVLNGECYAARTDIVRPLLSEFIDQRFLGKKFDSGDDGWMTTLLLKNGFKTVYQSTAVTETEPPVMFREFIQQQLRWCRNSTRRSCYAISSKWAWSKHWLYPFHLFVTLIKTPIWIVILGLAIGFLIFGGRNESQFAELLGPIWTDWRLAIFVLGLILVRGIRGAPYLWSEPRALYFLPLYAFIAPFILAPMRMYGMLTVRNSSWMTRGVSAKMGDSIAVLLVFVSALLGMGLLVASPVAAATLAAALDGDYDLY